MALSTAYLRMFTRLLYNSAVYFCYFYFIFSMAFDCCAIKDYLLTYLLNSELPYHGSCFMQMTRLW